jgi:hypothetical protein
MYLEHAYKSAIAVVNWHAAIIKNFKTLYKIEASCCVSQEFTPYTALTVDSTIGHRLLGRPSVYGGSTGTKNNNIDANPNKVNMV